MNKIKGIKFRDIIGVLKFIIILIPAVLYKQYLKILNKEVWLVCEKENMARDNGIAFYKYMKKKHPEIKCYYAINFKCNDYERIKDMKDVIKWSSLQHYFIYMSCRYNLTSHKEGEPNHPLFSILHRYVHVYNNMVFLQHGITKDNLPMFYYSNTRFKYFVCGAKREYDFVLDQFGYPQKNVIYTGFARFDNLYENDVDKRKILFIPTWRRWLDSEEEVFNSQYYRNLCEIINSDNIGKLLNKYDKYLYFYPHASMQKYLKNFKITNPRIKLCDISNSDIQELLKSSSLMITDYSSVYFDFAYMEKPVIYFQNDYYEYREKHMPEGYFDYEEDGFGKVCYSIDELEEQLRNYLINNFKVEEKYIERMKNFFELKDCNNCERIFQKIYKRG